MTRDQAADRQAFEQFMLQRNAATRLARQSFALGGHYRTTTVQRAWELWQAAVIHAFADPRIAGLEAARIAYASEFPLNADGDPDVGNIHANIRKLKAELAALKAPAPIPPNSRELEPAICGCGDEYPAGGWDAGFIAALGHCANCAAALDPVTPEPPATPWYPDDSGEWVEVPEDLMEMPRDLGGEELISILTREMREDEYFDGQEDDRWGDLPPPKARLWEWDTPPNVSSRIVAYKVVKP